MPKAKSQPTYQHHKARNLAKTIVNGKTIYLGPYNSPESQEKFEDILAEWRLRQNVDQYGLKVDELAWRFIEHAESYYLHADGTPTGETNSIKHALSYVLKSHGRCLVRQFGALKLKEVREAMIAAGICRTSINRQIHRIKRMFSWAVGAELIPVAVYQALQAVRGLSAGRTKAVESVPVQPVDAGTVNDTLPHLSNVVADSGWFINEFGEPHNECAYYFEFCRKR